MTVKKQQESATEQVKDQEKEHLKSEVNELKEMVKQLLASQQAQTTKTQEVVEEDPYRDIEDELNISPHEAFKIVSMVDGGLNLKGSNITVSLPDFGATRRIPFEELRVIYNNHPELTREGAFFIVSKKAVQALYLDEDYKQILSQDKMEKIIDLPTGEIVHILKNATKIQRDTILQRIIKGIPSGDNRYTDWNKIKAISDFVGQDLMELAKEIE